VASKRRMIHCQEPSLANQTLDFRELESTAALLRYRAASLGSAVSTLRATVKEDCIYEKLHSRHTVIAKEIVGVLTIIAMVQ
jgi:hypothetical protein